MKTLVILVLVAAASASEGEEFPDGRPMERPDLFEGDILLPPGTDRNAIASDYQRWPNGVIPVLIDNSLSNVYYNIMDAMEEYHSKTCIKFTQRTNEAAYVYMFAGNGCYSMVGRIGNAQQLSLGRGCYDHGTIVHELGHAVGFYHEHSRSDRDNYITIYWNNIDANMRNQFDKLAPHQNRLYEPFDYDSIMLYGSTAFSANGYWTMTTRSGQQLREVYHKPGLSASDVRRINKLYGC